MTFSGEARPVRAIIFDFYGVLLLGDGGVNEPLLQFIEIELKPHYAIGLLSNSGSRAELDGCVAPGRLDALFDEVMSSGEISLMKPQPEVFAYAAAKLGALPEECIMVDDMERYCRGAEEAGMQAVQFIDTAAAAASILALIEA